MEVQKRNNEKEIYAPLKGKWLVMKPEEEVRQKYICRLVDPKIRKQSQWQSQLQ